MHQITRPHYRFHIGTLLNLSFHITLYCSDAKIPCFYNAFRKTFQRSHLIESMEKMNLTKRKGRSIQYEGSLQRSRAAHVTFSHGKQTSNEQKHCSLTKRLYGMAYSANYLKGTFNKAERFPIPLALRNTFRTNPPPSREARKGEKISRTHRDRVHHIA